jgi:phosphopentomutase
MFYGVPPERHGVWTNVWQPIVPPIKSIVDVVHEAGRKTGMFFNWGPLRDLAAPGSVDAAHMIRFGKGPRDPSDARLFELAAEWMRKTPDFGFAFVYYGAADNTGHEHQWMSPPYLESIAEADRLIGEMILPAIGHETLLIVTADHGGHEWTHGEDVDEDMTVPIILRANGIAAGSTLKPTASVIDIAPTALDWLGLPAPADWQGASLLTK